MRARAKFIMSLSFVLILTACGSKERVAIQTNIESEPSETDEEMTKEQRLKSLFVEQLKLNMSENDVRDLFGANFKLVRNAMLGNESWRYDLGAIEEYAFDDQGIDRVDIEGLKLGRLQQQLFVDWSPDGTLSSASLYMRSDEGEGYFIYELLEDGTNIERFHSYE